LTRQNMTLHVTVCNAQFIVKTCESLFGKVSGFCLEVFASQGCYAVWWPRRAKTSLLCSFWVQDRIRLALKGRSDELAALLDTQPWCSFVGLQMYVKILQLIISPDSL
jgi:hypothetical protein